MVRPKILHLIGSLSVGGAERVLCNLLSRCDRSMASYSVATLVPGGPLQGELQQLPVPVHTIGMRRGVSDPRGLLRLRKLLRQERPDVVVSWMYHSNLLGGLAAKFAGNIPVVWNIRDSGPGVSRFRASTRVVAKAACAFSHVLPDRIVFVSKSGFQLHVASGYSERRSTVIPNGFDTATFCPDTESRSSIRRELGLTADAMLAGIIGRFHPDKDHRNFIDAACRIHAVHPNAHFLMCGEGVAADNRELSGWIESAGIAHVTHLLGRRHDMPCISASLDLLVSSSSAEAFPNVIGEAMSCGVPCVVTNVGDSAHLVGETGEVAPPGDPDKLAESMLKLMRLPAAERIALGQAARRRIVERFSIEQIVPLHERLWLNTIAKHNSRTHETVRPAA